MAFKIYTKTGDLGNTSLIGGTKVPKCHMRIDAYGTVDELNAHIGLLGDYFVHPNTQATLREIQDRLFTVGASLACDPDKESLLKIPDLNERDIVFLEESIDAMNAVLPPMKSFVLPGGHIAVSTAHVARCVCRRSERCCVSMQVSGLFVEPLVIKYLNRLSDYLFVLGRFIALELKVAEVPWQPRV